MRTIIILIVLALVVEAQAGKVKVREAVGGNRKEAIIKAEATDADASVKWSRITNDLNDAEIAIDAINMATVDIASIDANAWTGAQKTEIQDLKNVLQAIKSIEGDLKTAVKNAVQAEKKITRKLMRQEEIKATVGQ